MKEIEIYHLCRGQPNIIQVSRARQCFTDFLNHFQLVEFFEDDQFCLVFEKVGGGPLLDHIQARICFTEAEASSVMADLAGAVRWCSTQLYCLGCDNLLTVYWKVPAQSWYRPPRHQA